MATMVTLAYYTEFGRGDWSDSVEYFVTLKGREEETYLRALKLRLPIEEQKGMKRVLNRARPKIEKEAIQSLLDGQDWSAMEWMGVIPVSANEINRLVAARDPHTLAFFGLTGMSEKKLDKWDAAKLKKLPEVREFQKDFEPRNPYDVAYSLGVSFWEHPEEEELEEDEARETLKELLSDAAGNFREVRGYIKRCDDLYTGDDLKELAAEIAEELGLTDFAAELRGKA